MLLVSNNKTLTTKHGDGFSVFYSKSSLMFLYSYRKFVTVICLAEYRNNCHWHLSNWSIVVLMEIGAVLMWLPSSINHKGSGIIRVCLAACYFSLGRNVSQSIKCCRNFCCCCLICQGMNSGSNFENGSVIGTGKMGAQTDLPSCEVFFWCTFDPCEWELFQMTFKHGITGQKPSPIVWMWSPSLTES